MRRTLKKSWLVLLWHVFVLSAAFGQDPGSWRFWTVTDRLRESYLRSLAVDPNGRVWMRHGSVSTMSEFNGYSVDALADPRPSETLSLAPDFGIRSRVNGTSDGDL